MSKRTPWIAHRNPDTGAWCVLRGDKILNDAKTDRYVVPPGTFLTEIEAHGIAAMEDLRDACSAMIQALSYRGVPYDPLNPMHDDVFKLMIDALHKSKGRKI